jgi:hypothetical protein
MQIFMQIETISIFSPSDMEQVIASVPNQHGLMMIASLDDPSERT